MKTTNKKYSIADQIPKRVNTKIYKTGQTRGADDDVIYQNRVARNSTVLIPYSEYEICVTASPYKGKFENQFIVLIKPEEYFKPAVQDKLKTQKLSLGKNLLVFYETRQQWEQYPVDSKWKEAKKRVAPLGGQYVARIPATTSEGQSKIVRGFNTSSMKGAGIRVYEYADKTHIDQCKIQLEYLFWQCKDVLELTQMLGLPEDAVKERINFINAEAKKYKLDDKDKLIKERIIDNEGHTICPLCLKKISAKGFCDTIKQAEGREVPDLTVTEVSLFHIHELRTGEYNHRPYNLGWGHHHCNVVVKDSGIEATLDWMKDVLKRNNMI